MGENLLGAAAGSATRDLFLPCVIKGGYVNSKSLPDLPNSAALLTRLPADTIGLAVIASRSTKDSASPDSIASPRGKRFTPFIRGVFVLIL